MTKYDRSGVVRELAKFPDDVSTPDHDQDGLHAYSGPVADELRRLEQSDNLLFESLCRTVQELANRVKRLEESGKEMQVFEAEPVTPGVSMIEVVALVDALNRGREKA